MAKPKKPQTFPVMDGAQSAPREDQVAGIVENSRAWHPRPPATRRRTAFTGTFRPWSVAAPSRHDVLRPSQ